ncbi:hypothetical protein BGX21_002120 [Mortierella sp. AD011]|nr:hypothetical protein BGX21_002120 [Mortierella sp. AD011]
MYNQRAMSTSNLHQVDQQKAGNNADLDLVDIACFNLGHPTTNNEQEEQEDETEDRAETEDEEGESTPGNDNIDDGAASEASTVEGAESIEKGKAS